MRLSTAVAGCCAAFLCATSAFAEARHNFSIPAQRLDSALIALGAQAQVSIGGIDARLGAARSRPLRGAMTTTQALRILMRDTGFDFAVVDATTVRVFPVPFRPATRPAPRPARPVAPAVLPKAEIIPDIVVTATKQDQGLDSYPGTAHVERIGGVGLLENLGTGAFVARLPALTSTNLGPGRNKIFVRGIADSSFSGPTQSTVGLYLGDLRLTYNAPEPDLRLYDIDRIEVIEGPQGTLYGAGTLGGIVRIMPKLPDLEQPHAFASGGVSSTAYGAEGFDVGGMINMPIIEDRVALRVVGYRQIEGGYIDNVTLGTRNTNRSRIDGGRAALRVRAGDGWTIDLSGVVQNIDTRDAQYAEKGLPVRAHAALIAQPHDNDFQGASLAVTKTWDRLTLTSSTGIVRHSLSEVFDASGFQGTPGTLVYQDQNAIHLLTHETRLSHNSEDGGSWVAGLSYVHNSDRVQQTLGPPGAPAMLTQLRNAKVEIALFGEATRPISQRWFATLGSRFAYADTIGELLGAVGPDFEPRRKQLRILPTAALSWKARPDLLAFLRYQSGFRSGGLAITAGATNTTQRFDSDEIHTVEMGMRFGHESADEPRSLSGGVTGFYSGWNSIQADLISDNGLPYTANIGRGRVFGIEASAVWKLATNLTLDAALFANDSALISPAPGLEDADSNRLPNIARLGGRASFAWTRPVKEGLDFKLDGTVRYVGKSSLGTASPLLLEQGETVQADLSAGFDGGTWRIVLDATNLTNEDGNSFAFGNPFSVALGRQTTPLRPRGVRLGLWIGF